MIQDGPSLKVQLTGDEGVCEALSSLWRAHVPIESFYSPPTFWRLAAGALRADVTIGVLMAGSPRLLARLVLFPKPMALLWIGTDVYDVMRRPGLRRTVPVLNRVVPVHFAVAPHLVRELADVGIRAELFPLVPPSLDSVERPSPERHRVIFYSTPGREDFYGAAAATRLASEFPRVEFVAVGGGSVGHPLMDRGRVEPAELEGLYSVSTLLFRPAAHDGLPKMSLEALRYGLHVVGSAEIPGCRYARSPEDALNAAREILSAPPSLNARAAEGLREYDPVLWARRHLERLRALKGR